MEQIASAGRMRVNELKALPGSYSESAFVCERLVGWRAAFAAQRPPRSNNPNNPIPMHLPQQPQTTLEKRR